MVSRECESPECRERFAPTRPGGHIKRFCSRPCQARAKYLERHPDVIRLGPVEQRQCESPECDRSFDPTRQPRRRFCSGKCRSRARHLAEPDRRRSQYWADPERSRAQQRAWKRRLPLRDPVAHERQRARHLAYQREVAAKAKAFDAMFEPVLAWWSAVKVALQERDELPEPPVSEVA